MKIKKFNENNTNTNKQKFVDALETLFHSWGSDTPPEVFWGCNELLDWYELEFNVNLGIRFDEENPDNFDDVIDAIMKS